MNINIEKRNYDQLNCGTLKNDCGNALDALWEKEWVKNSITKTDRQSIESVNVLADEIVTKNETVVFICSGRITKVIKALNKLVPCRRQGLEIIVTGDSFASEHYAELSEKLKAKKFSIIAATDGNVSLTARGAYATFKKMLISNVGAQQAAERMYAFTPKGDNYFAEEAVSSDFPLFTRDFGSYKEMGTSLLVLLLIGLKGVDVGTYLDGFYNMLASPIWDLNGADYAIAKAAYMKENKVGVIDFIYWQESLGDLSSMMMDFTLSCNPRVVARVIDMPANHIMKSNSSFETYFILEKENEDVLMPYFDGCNEDGSLNLLLKSESERDFEQGKDDVPRSSIKLQNLEDNTLGELIAYIQLSEGIVEYFLNN